MNRKSLKVLSVGFLISILVAISAFPTSDGFPTGITNPTTGVVEANGCNCHGPEPTTSVSVELTLPANFTAGGIYTLTLNISGGPNDDVKGDNYGGFFIKATHGVLEPLENDTNVQKPFGETHLTHTAEGNDYRGWSFSWTAPDKDDVIVTFSVYGNSVNGADASGNDYWNSGSFNLMGVNAVAISDEHVDGLTGPQKAIYAFTVLAITLGVVVIGNRMITNEQSFEKVLKDAWKAIYPWLTTTDHKYIGLLYISTGFIFLFIAGFLALLIRVQLFEADSDFMTDQEYNSTFTMHGTTMIFMAAMPIIFGFANYLVPLQIGARDLAFPRLNALSFWLLPTGGLLIYAGYFTGGAGDVGWTGYAPYSSGATATRPGTDFWVAGQIMLGASSTLTAINFLTTILRMRAPGVTFMKMPLYTWSMFVTVFLLLLSIPVFTVALILLMADRTFGTLYFSGSCAGDLMGTTSCSDPILWQHLFWYFGHPEVYILILPAFGVLSEIVSTFSRRPIFGYTSMVYAMASIGIISFIVYGHHMFTSGADPLFRFVVMLTTMLVGVPTGIKIFNWLATMTGGSVVTKTPMLFALGTILTFTIGGITGVILAMLPLDIALHDTYFVIGHLHYVAVGGVLFAFLAGVYYWYPKMIGKMLNEKLGLLHFVLSFISFNVAFYPMHNVGLAGMPRRYASYDSSLTELNQLISIGAFIFGIVQLILVYNLIYSFKYGEEADDNPWGGWSLEWATSSPPPHNSFKEIPTLESAEEGNE
ncbi:MAG: cytochrome c oxidase subunit I [Candidatus Poseidoniia archaeon]|nr:cytochrome c oxidase subunit I [Candidatus Poseidoniia archaeon]